MSLEDVDSNALAALGGLVEKVISEPSLREKFRKDPYGTAEAAGVDIAGIPSNVVATLASLSVAELRLLTELNEVFVSGGLAVSPSRDAMTTMMVF